MKTALTLYLESIGAIFDGRTAAGDIGRVEQRLGIELPAEFRDHFADFKTCGLPADSIWDFFSLEEAVARTEYYRENYNVIRYDGDSIPSSGVFAFCDALMDAPTYFVIASRHSEHFGYILGAHGADGWVVGTGLDSFLRAFRRDQAFALLFGEDVG